MMEEGPCKTVSPSLRRKPESRKPYWIPAKAGMTVRGELGLRDLMELRVH